MISFGSRFFSNKYQYKCNVALSIIDFISFEKLREHTSRVISVVNMPNSWVHPSYILLVSLMHDSYDVWPLCCAYTTFVTVELFRSVITNSKSRRIPLPARELDESRSTSASYGFSPFYLLLLYTIYRLYKVCQNRPCY